MEILHFYKGETLTNVILLSSYPFNLFWYQIIIKKVTLLSGTYEVSLHAVVNFLKKCGCAINSYYSNIEQGWVTICLSLLRESLMIANDERGSFLLTHDSQSSVLTYTEKNQTENRGQAKARLRSKYPRLNAPA